MKLIFATTRATFVCSLVALTLAIFQPAPAWADEFQPVAVRIKLTTANDLGEMIYKIETRIPNDRRLKEIPRAILHAPCTALSDNLSQLSNSSYKRVELVRCTQSLHGAKVEIAYQNRNPGLSSLLAIEHANGESASTALAAHQTTWEIPNQLNSSQIGWQYFKLGVEHLLSGFDHLLFISCLLFICIGQIRKLIWTITAFTLAHSLSLGLTAFGKISINVIAVETIIALSIAYLASDIARHSLRRKRNTTEHQSLSYRYPASIAALFGLLHGLGFANILNEFGLPQTDKLLALLSFNIGIEIGQLLFVAAVLLLIGLLKKVWTNIEQSIQQGTTALISSYAIGTIALFWTVQRALSVV